MIDVQQAFVPGRLYRHKDTNAQLMAIRPSTGSVVAWQFVRLGITSGQSALVHFYNTEVAPDVITTSAPQQAPGVLMKKFETVAGFAAEYNGSCWDLEETARAIRDECPDSPLRKAAEALLVALANLEREMRNVGYEMG